MGHPKFESIDFKTGTMIVEVPHPLSATEVGLIKGGRIVRIEGASVHQIDAELKNPNPIIKRNGLLEAARFLQAVKNHSPRGITQSDLSSKGILQRATDALIADFEAYLSGHADDDVHRKLKDLRGIKQAFLEL